MLRPASSDGVSGNEDFAQLEQLAWPLWKHPLLLAAFVLRGEADYQLNHGLQMPRRFGRQTLLVQ
jgi:hypothetical protein